MTREDAIENLKGLLESNYVDSFEDEENESLRIAIQALEQNESAEEWYKLFVEKLEQEPKWIPVSERLPEIGDYVLCSVANYYSKYKIAISQYNRENFWHNGIIEAWMPLPKPYEPQESK